MKFKEYLLKDIATITMGQSPKSQFYNEDGKGIEFLQGVRTFGEDFPYFDTYTTKYNRLAYRNSILFSVRAPVGRVNWATKNIAIGRGVASISVKNMVYDRYVYYYFKKMGSFYDKKATGTVFTSINKKELESLKIKVPASYDDQKRIADRLATLDRKIHLNQQLNANLLELAKTLFSEEFSSNEEVLLSNYFLPKRGKNLLKKNVVSGEFPVIAGGLKPAAFHNSYNTKAPVITISASGANAGYVQIWGQPVWSSDSSYIDTSITKDIYFWYLLLKKYQKQIFDAQTGSAQPHIYPKHIGNLLIPNISEDSIKNFNITITPIFKKIFQNKNENNKLKAIKNSLLIKYFN